jgi:hypothetical protein
MRAAAEVIQRYWEPGAVIVSAGPYEDVMSLGYYLPEPIALLGWDSVIEGTSDLEFGLRHGDEPGLVLSEADLRLLWNSPRRAFVIATRRPAPPGAPVLLRQPTFSLVTNHPVAPTR